MSPPYLVPYQVTHRPPLLPEMLKRKCILGRRVLEENQKECCWAPAQESEKHRRQGNKGNEDSLNKDYVWAEVNTVYTS